MRDWNYCFCTQRLNLNWWIEIASAVHKFSICIAVEPTLLTVCMVLKEAFDETEWPDWLDSLKNWYSHVILLLWNPKYITYNKRLPKSIFIQVVNFPQICHKIFRLWLTQRIASDHLCLVSCHNQGQLNFFIGYLSNNSFTE